MRGDIMVVARVLGVFLAVYTIALAVVVATVACLEVLW